MAVFTLAAGEDGTNNTFGFRLPRYVDLLIDLL